MQAIFHLLPDAPKPVAPYSHAVRTTCADAPEDSTARSPASLVRPYTVRGAAGPGRPDLRRLAHRG